MTTSVLICDDSNLARKQVFRSLPPQWTADVKFASNGLEGMSILREQKVDILFLDLTMPELDGIGVLNQILSERIEVQVFVISADIQPEMQSKVMELGAMAFIKKPVNPEILAATLQEGLIV